MRKPKHFEKIIRIWSFARARSIVVRVQYQRLEDQKFIYLRRIDPLDH